MHLLNQEQDLATLTWLMLSLVSTAVHLPDVSENAIATVVRVHADTAADPETGGTAPNPQVR